MSQTARASSWADDSLFLQRLTRVRVLERLLERIFHGLEARDGRLRLADQGRQLRADGNGNRGDVGRAGSMGVELLDACLDRVHARLCARNELVDVLLPLGGATRVGYRERPNLADETSRRPTRLGQLLARDLP